MREGRRIGHRRRADSLCRAPKTRAVGCRGAAPDPARGEHPPETPAPFPSNGIMGGGMQGVKGSQAAQKPRALDTLHPTTKTPP